MMRNCFWIGFGAIGLICSSCDRKPAVEPVPKPAQTSLTTTQTFQVKGIIVELKPAAAVARIKHEEIPNYMPAMTMPFTVLDTNELAELKPGDPVSFRMSVTKTDGWIDQIKKRDLDITEMNKTILPPDAGIRFVRDVEPLMEGDPLPNYTFTNQLGQAVNLTNFQGQAVAITFIFTRCPYPTFCPLMSNNFKEAYTALKSSPGGPTNWQLLEISIDPEYDSPQVLTAYADRYQNDPKHWQFLTGPLVDVTAITEQFGLQFVKDESGGISHNLRTVVVDVTGHIQKIIPENKWTPAELVEEIKRATAGK